MYPLTMYGSRRSEPFTWREPTFETQRCPKCHARLIVSPVEERCPYCDYRRHKALTDNPREEPAVLPSLKGQIRDALAEGSDSETARARFVSYEVPRELNTERYLLALLFVIVLVFLRFAYGGARRSLLPDDAPPYVWYAIVLPSLLYALTTFTTFLALKPLTVLVGTTAAAVGVCALSNIQLVPQLWNAAVPAWTAYGLLGYQVIAGVWAASIAWRDWKYLRS